MLTGLAALPESRSPPEAGGRLGLAALLLLFFAIILFPAPRLAGLLAMAGLHPGPPALEVAHYRRLLFLPCLLVMGWRLAPDVGAWLRSLGRPAFGRALLLATGVYLVLAVLAFPYPFPTGADAYRSGLGGIGHWYGSIAGDPFIETHEIVYRRLLMTALASYAGLTHPVDFYLLSQALSLLVILLTILFGDRAVPAVAAWPAPARLLLYASVCSASYVVFNSQLPGYPDILLYALLLLLLLVPLRPGARLLLVALCLATHDGAIFALLPLVLVMFPRRERLPALAVIGLYYVLLLASLGANLDDALRDHDVVGDSAHLGDLVTHAGSLLAGVFFSYKLLWAAAIAGVLLAARSPGASDWPGPALGAAALLLMPLPVILVAWDTTRLLAFGVAGMLVLAAVAGRASLRPRPTGLVIALLAANLLIPTNNVVIARPATAERYAYPGAYRFIYGLLAPAPAGTGAAPSTGGGGEH